MGQTNVRTDDHGFLNSMIVFISALYNTLHCITLHYINLSLASSMPGNRPATGI